MYGYGPPPWGYPLPTAAPQTKDDYVRYLKKELKDIKKAEGLKKDGSKKTEWWKRSEIVAIAFFSAPFLAPVYIGILKLSWMLVRSMLNAP